MEYITLNNSVKMPVSGIGTFLLSPDEAESSVLAALQDRYGERLCERKGGWSCHEKVRNFQISKKLIAMGLLRKEGFATVPFLCPGVT